nr:MAG TPA: hypothetical protein [Caudoviricetes sp.]
MFLRSQLGDQFPRLFFVHSPALLSTCFLCTPRCRWYRQRGYSRSL